MGADIHMYLEYADFDNAATGKPYWRAFAVNTGSRDYDMFALLANVRGDGALFEPRGLPEGALSWEVESAAFLRIDDDPERKDWDGYATREQATIWCEPIFERNGREYCAAPDWHSHSWLNLAEYLFVLGSYNALHSDHHYPAEYDAIAGAMEALDKRGCKTRLIIWFDN